MAPTSKNQNHGKQVETSHIRFKLRPNVNHLTMYTCTIDISCLRQCKLFVTMNTRDTT